MTWLVPELAGNMDLKYAVTVAAWEARMQSLAALLRQPGCLRMGVASTAARFRWIEARRDSSPSRLILFRNMHCSSPQESVNLNTLDVK